VCSVLHKVRRESVEYAQIDTDLRFNNETFDARVKNSTTIMYTSPSRLTHKTHPMKNIVNVCNTGCEKYFLSRRWLEGEIITVHNNNNVSYMRSDLN